MGKISHGMGQSARVLGIVTDAPEDVVPSDLRHFSAIHGTGIPLIELIRYYFATAEVPLRPATSAKKHGRIDLIAFAKSEFQSLCFGLL